MHATRSWQRLTAIEAVLLLEREGLAIFDIRDEASFTQGHIDGARYLSNANLERAILRTPKNKPVLIYCYHGNASQTCAEMFLDFGFQEVYDLIGGYEAWQAHSTFIPEAELCAI